MNYKKQQLRQINQERTIQQQIILDQMNNDVKSLNDYQTDLLKTNKQKEEAERNEMERQFQYRLKAANENINNHLQNKKKEREQRNQEKYKFSPNNIKTGGKSIDLDGGNVLEDVLSQGQTSNLFNTMKPPTPQYNDFLNDIFAKKSHISYKLAEKTELRAKIIQDKFKG